MGMWECMISCMTPYVEDMQKDVRRLVVFICVAMWLTSWLWACLRKPMKCDE